MAEARMRIDRLEVRVRGMREPEARGLAGALGPAVLQKLNAAVLNRHRSPRSTHVDTVDVGTVTFTGREPTATAIAQAVANRLADNGDR